jgi:ADP-ribose pyrophosphatase
MRATRSVFQTRWFQVVERAQGEAEPYYMLELPDYVSVVALTPSREIVLVRQFRPVVDRETLELPSGHVDNGEAPEDAARRELIEETAFVAPHLELLGTLVPDVGRLANRMWCYFAGDVYLTQQSHVSEEGVSVVLLSEREALRQAVTGGIDHALNLATLYLAIATGKLSLT